MAKLSTRTSTSNKAEKSKQIGLAEHFYKLSQDLEKAKENPALKALEQLKKDGKSLLNNFLSYDSVTLDKKISELRAEASNPLIQSALNNQTPFIESLLKDTKIHDLDKLQKSLAFDYKQYLKPEFSATKKAIESLQQTINSPILQNSILEAPKLKAYESEVSRLSKSIANNQNLFGSAKGLAALGQRITSDSLKHKLEEQSSFAVPEIIQKNYDPIKIPANPVIGQNEEIISVLKNLQAQNETLINYEQSDQEIQQNMILDLKTQQNQNEIVIEELQSQNSGIQSQLKELIKQNNNVEKQLSQKEIEIEENKQSNKFTRKIAILGIGISIVVGIASSIIPFYISNVEMEDNNQDNKEILKAVNNKSVQNKNMSLLIKETQIQNKLNKNIEKNQLKVLKAIEKQNKFLHEKKQQFN